MKVNSDRERNRNNLTELVRRRIEKKAAGITVNPDYFKAANLQENSTHSTDGNEENLADEFSSLLLDSPFPVHKSSLNSSFSYNERPDSFETENKPNSQNFSSKVDGTTRNFSTLNKQETCEIKGVESKKTEFSFTLEDFGEVKVKGELNGGKLEVRINLSTTSLLVVPKFKRTSLERVLRIQLESVLGVSVGVHFD